MKFKVGDILKSNSLSAAFTVQVMDINMKSKTYRIGLIEFPTDPTLEGLEWDSKMLEAEDGYSLLKSKYKRNLPIWW